MKNYVKTRVFVFILLPSLASATVTIDDEPATYTVNAVSWSGAKATLNLHGSVTLQGPNYAGGTGAFHTDGGWDGHVTTQFGGDLYDASRQIDSDVVGVVAKNRAFAALKDNGSVVSWGNTEDGGDTTAVYGDYLSSGVYSLSDGSSFGNGFSVTYSNGNTFEWKDANSGQYTFVPEPSTLPLFLFGMTLFPLWRRFCAQNRQHLS